MALLVENSCSDWTIYHILKAEHNERINSDCKKLRRFALHLLASGYLLVRTRKIMKKKLRLSGWQRLWVVFCGVCLLVTAVLTVLALPSGYEYERKRLLDSIDLVSRHNAFVQRLEAAGFSKAEIEEHLSKGGKLDDQSAIDHEAPGAIRARHYADLSDQEILTRLYDKYSKKVDFTSIEGAYRKNIVRLKTERLEFILFAFLIWCGVSLGVYGLGFSVGWVVKGFREKNQS